MQQVCNYIGFVCMYFVVSPSDPLVSLLSSIIPLPAPNFPSSLLSFFGSFGNKRYSGTRPCYSTC